VYVKSQSTHQINSVFNNILLFTVCIKFKKRQTTCQISMPINDKNYIFADTCVAGMCVCDMPRNKCHINDTENGAVIAQIAA